MSTINGVGANSYYYTPVNYPQNEPNNQTTNDSTTNSAAANATNSSANETTANNTSTNSLNNNNLSASVMASLLSIKATNDSTLLNAINNQSNSTNDSNSLFNMLKLTSKYTMLKDGVSPELVSQLFGDTQTSAPNNDSTAETENTDPSASVMNLLNSDSNSTTNPDNTLQDILNLSSKYEMLKQGMHPANDSNTSNTAAGNQNTGSSSDSTK